MANESRIKWALLAGCASLLSTGALAQVEDKAPAAADAPQPGDIVVTAQKRAQRAFDVPLSITAISGDEIASKGASAIEDVQFSVPGLSVTQFSPGQQRVQLRGVSAFSGLPTVGVYLDELPLNTETGGTGMDVRMVDIERVEILRGPQGTLYGQGAMGGTIRYITADPKLDRFEVKAGGEVGFIDKGGVDWRVNGVVNAPIVEDKLAIRLAGEYQRFGGWIDNVTLGDKDTNDGDNLMVRGKLLFQPTDALKVVLLGQHQEVDLDSTNMSDADGAIAQRLRSPFRSKADLANLTISYDFGGATLLSSTGYLNRKDVGQADVSASFIPLFELPAPFGFGFPAGTFQSIGLQTRYKNEIFTQEVRLSSNGDGPLSWTVGGMFRDSQAGILTQSAVTPDILPFDLIAIDGTSPSDSRSWAAFGEVTWRVVPAIEATVGLRYFHDRRKLVSRSTVLGTTSVDNESGSFKSLSPRFNLLWHVTDHANLYVNVAKGFRSGGFNLASAGLGLVTVPTSYDPETLWSYEFGGKFQSSDGVFSAEAAVYRNEWSDVQSLAFAPGFPISFTTNGAKLAGWGADLALTFRPVPAFSLTLTGSHNDMTYRSTTPEHNAGDPADYVPSFTASVSGEYRFDLSPSLPAYLRVDYQTSDPYQVFVRNTQVAPVETGTLDFLNARIGIDAGKWSLALFAKNILNERGVTYPAFGSLIVPIRPQPRVLGIAATIGF